jgi:hypothetical protein
MEAKERIKPGELLKLITGREALIYRVVSLELTAVKIVEFCRISKGKLLLNFGGQLESNIFHSDAGTTYRKVTKTELDRIIEILKGSIEDLKG